MKITVLPNLPYGDSIAVTNAIISHFAKDDVQLLLPERAKEYITKSDNVILMPYQEIMESCDIVIAVGGDGTVTKYASDAALHAKPILGINAGHLGFLSGLEKGEISHLSALISGEYEIKNRMMLHAQIFDEDGKEIFSEYCVNDAVIGRGQSSRMVDLSMELDGKHLSNHRADGIIIATPTGSTAYSMSAGGPVADPLIECMIVTPICSHSLSARSIVCSSESTILLRNHSDAQDIRKAYLTTDSREAVEVPFGGCVRIKKAEKSIEFITIKSQSFYDILKEKMIERNLG